MEADLINLLLGIILTSLISQTIAIWVKLGNLEKTITKNKCPFGTCPLYSRAVEEAVPQRIIEEVEKGR